MKITFFFSFLFFMQLHCMEIQKYQCVWNDIPREIQSIIIGNFNDVLTINRFRCTNKKNKSLCNWEICIEKKRMFDVTALCADFDLCERGLIHYAKHNKRIFNYLWNNQSTSDDAARVRILDVLDSNRRDWSYLRIYKSLPCEKIYYVPQKTIIRELKKDWRLLRILLVHGLDPNADFGSQKSLLHGAVQLNNMRAVKLLLRYGADVNKKSKWRWTPLHYACQNGLIKIARYLIKNNAFINVVRSDNWTPLACACSGNSLSLVRLLLRKGADATLGANPRYIAYCGGYKDILQLFDAYKIPRCADERIPIFVGRGAFFFIALELFLLEHVLLYGIKNLYDGSNPLLFY